MAAQLMRVLVANRGEIACRILRTLRVLGVPSVAIFTPPDAQSPHVWLADCAYALGHVEDYMNAKLIIATAQRAGVTHIHPGYGFLSQSAAFAQAVADAKMIFIGPSPRAMRLLGNKQQARQLAESLGIQVIAGAQKLTCPQHAVALAKTVGLPVLLKASGGGGGRGMRRIDDVATLPEALVSAKREAETYFGDGTLLLERYIHPARHIEIQIIADGACTQVLGERECSLQRRYQKILEEGPVTHLTAVQRQRLYEAAIRLGEASGYIGAGTVEFLLGPDAEVYFLEVNTRLQVEHPVTEMCTGLDVVALQLEVAQGVPLRQQDAWRHRGHAVEVRLNAESPHEHFLPQTGTVSQVHWPQVPNVRVDAGIAEGTMVGSDYDPLLAKVIAWGKSREVAFATLRCALDELVVLGVEHNHGFLVELLSQDFVKAQQTFTTTLEEHTWDQVTAPGYVTSLQPQRLVAKQKQAAAVPKASGPWQLLSRSCGSEGYHVVDLPR